MSQLPKEWERVRNQLLDGMDNPVYRVGVENTVERCYALANKPVRELTDDECYKLWCEIYGGKWDNNDWAGLNSGTEVIRAIIAAHQRKQQEPETVTFRAARNRNDHSEIYMAKADSDWSGSNWEWLPGEPQTIEVKLPFKQAAARIAELEASVLKILEAEVARLRVDGERLDWCEQAMKVGHPSVPYWDDLGFFCYPYLVNGSPRGGGVGTVNCGQSLRAAIDAAKESA